MKKIITTALIATALLSSQASAMKIDIMPITNLEPSVISHEVKEKVILTPVQELLKKYELVLRNNKIKADYKYNSTTYYTSKIETDNLFIPKEIMDKANKIYFLVEEGNDRVYFKNSAMMEDETIAVEEVKKEYNYKIVDFKQGQEEYIFENKDLVKDFGNGEYSNVIISLIVEFSETEKVALTNSSYVTISTKAEILNRLQNDNKEKYSYFGYYNSNDLEEYLERLSEKLTRSDYKKILVKADKKIESGLVKNDKVKDVIIKSITKESDFKQYIEKYAIYSETESLFSSLARAVKNQLQNIRAFDAIDSILK